MLSEKCDFQLVNLNDTMYAIGGYGVSSNTVEMFGLGAGKWSPSAPLGTP